MATFSDVFSITWKVLLALGIVSAIIGTKTTEDRPAGIAKTPQLQFDEADAFRTTMPKSVWDKGIERAVKKRCFIQGMNKEEVTRAVGEPTTKTSSPSGNSWTYQLSPGKRLKYDGDTCIEKETHEQIVFFTPKGNVWMGEGCETLAGCGKIVLSQQFLDRFESCGSFRASEA